MLNAANYDVPGDRFDLSYRRPPLSDSSAIPILVGMGDPVSGPIVGLFYDDPSSPEQLAGPTDLTPAHGHPCDNFRIVMKGELWVGRERYHHGEFRLQRTGTPYGADGDAPHVEGNWRIIFFADRRGHMVRPTNREARQASQTPEAVAATKERFGSVLPVMLEPDDNGVDGLVTTVDKPFSRLGHVDASFEEAGTWEPIGDGARTAVTLMGVHDLGPVVILQRTPAGAVASPAVTFPSDVFRCVIAGSHQRDGRLVEMGDTRFQAGGVPWEAVVAGPDGLDEVIIIGDRRGAVPQPEGADDAGWSARLNTLIDGLRHQLGQLVAP